MQQGKMEELADGLKGYIGTNIELLKLEGTERISVVGSVLISAILMGTLGLLFVFFLSLTTGFYLSSLLEDAYSGFGIVAGFYLLIALILVLGRKKLAEIIRNKIVGKVLNT